MQKAAAVTLLEETKEQVIAWRRYLHQHPELSFQEEKTSQFVYETLQTFGQLEITRPTKTSVMARLIGTQPGKVLALRADIDALPIQEETDVPFASDTPGVMHACGHDAHTAMLLGVAKILTQLRDQIKGEVRFLFQHAEEFPPGGAVELVEAGALDGVDMIIGEHVISTLDVGKVMIGYGAQTAAGDTFTITINGKGGHAAMPHETVDSLAVGVQVVANLQHVVARMVDPLESGVLSVTQFHAGSANNIIPDSAQIGGTVRTVNPEVRKLIRERMEQVVKGITQAHGAAYEMVYEYGYDSVFNDEQVTQKVEAAAREAFGDETVLIGKKPTMGGEDFSAYLRKVPGTFINIGAGDREKGMFPHHHPRFYIDEEALAIGVKTFVYAVFTLLEE